MPIKPNSERTPEEIRRNCSKAGKASVEAKRKKKLLRECLEILLEKDAAKGPDGKPINGIEAMSIVAMQGAINGDWEAWKLVRDTIGQKPVEKVVVADIEQSVIDDVERIVGEME